MGRWLILICCLLGLPAQAQDTLRLGVFGVVESVAPLTVAGQRIVMPDGQRIISPLGAEKSVQRGDVLAIATQVVQGKLTATRIFEVYAIVGPVSQVRGRIARIMGTAVHIPPNEALNVGDWVAVSGFWSGETVITTNIRRVGAAGFGHLTSTVDEETMRAGGSDLRRLEWPPDGFGGNVWSLSGTAQDNGLVVRLLAKGVFGGDVDLALWQGHASPPVASQTYAIYGTGITGTARDAQMPAAGALISRCARGGRVVRAAPEALETAYLLLGCARYTLAD
ncbi:hypothetical protein [uncultured Sulfitobacter sp.]|uniref:hypothetical protein n=1 Tax=uncultured Sulfitobacter sp. TaxID=191468 RepID=UPI0026137629|nr:hypothetical protein [uncultured Sulfitobacter sp.]